MRSPTARLILGALAVVVAAGATWYLVQLDTPVAERRAALESFDRSARSVNLSLEGARAAQIAYVVEGQGPAIWAPTVAAALAAVPADIDALSALAGTTEARAMLIEAAARLQAFADVDSRALEYVRSGDTLMASDLIFAEGAPSVAGAVELVDSAWQHENEALKHLAADHRAREIYAAGSGIALVLAIAFLLALVPAAAPAKTPRPQTARQSGSDLDLKLHEETLEVPKVTSNPEPARVDDLAKESPAQSVSPAESLSSPGNSELVTLMRSAAEVCVSLGAVRDPGHLRQLVTQAADLMKAPRLIIWVGDASGGDLRAAVAHGYPLQTLSRMPAISPSADNAVAAAYRSGTLQVVHGASGNDPGAIIAPIVTPDGCVGALTAELSAGNEHSEAIQALSLIFAAQLSALLAGDAAADGSGVRAASA